MQISLVNILAQIPVKEIPLFPSYVTHQCRATNWCSSCFNRYTSTGRDWEIFVFL